MKLKGFLVIIILGAAIYVILHYIQSGVDSDLPEKIQAISKTGEMTTEMNMKSLQREIVSYMAEQGDTPESLDKIFILKPSLKGIADVWGTRIDYKRISDSSFLLLSAGKDMKFNTSDDILLEY
jgi:hypothetical protein